MQNCNCNWYEYRFAYLLVSIEENQNKPKKQKKKKKRGEIHAELKVVEALNNSGQSNTQEKKMCSVLFN